MLGAADISRFGYMYDQVGNRTEMTQTRSTATVASVLTYVYDDLDRLTQATDPLPAMADETFTYDALGNRLLRDGQSVAATFDAANRLTEDEDFCYAYDLNGNLGTKTAKIAGACTGGGAGIAAACDLRIATQNLKFGFPIARTLGNTLSIANLSRLAALIGAGRVKEVIFTARLVEAREAVAIGLVSEILPDHGALIARATALADQLAGHAPLTLSTTKEALRRLRLSGAGADDRDLIVKAYMSEDFREGMEAFLGKRKPKWTGR